MEIRIIAEGPADKEVIKAIVRAVTNAGSENIVGVLPSDLLDETDKFSGDFSNWLIVLEKIADEDFMAGMMATVEGEFIIAVHIDAAERGEKHYDVAEPLRTGFMDWNQYASDVRENVKQKLEAIIPTAYRDHIAYAIAVEETDAWIIPMFEKARHDTASYAQPKERLRRIIGVDNSLQKKYVDTKK